MNPGDIFLKVRDDGSYETDRNGAAKVFMVRRPHERVRDAYYVTSVRTTPTGRIHRIEGEPQFQNDVAVFREVEVIA